MATTGTTGNQAQRISAVLTEDAWQGDADAVIRVDGNIVFQGRVVAQNGFGWTQTVDLGSYDASADHAVTVEFDNAASGGTADATRALQVQDILVDGVSTGQSASLTDNGTAGFQVAAVLPPSAAAPVEVGTGSQTIHIQASEDAWQGDAQMVVTVDGTPVGFPVTVTASHARGAVQDILIHGDWGAGQHTVTASFVNDAWGGIPDTDRNLYVQGIALDGVDMGGAAAFYSNGSTGVTGSFASAPATVTASTAATPDTSPNASTGTSTDSLVVYLSEDAYDGDAQFTVSVDGQQLGAAQSVTALHGSGAPQAFSFAASLTPGAHQVSVSFLNDKWDPGAGDRNLFVEGITVNGVAVPVAETALLSNGRSDFGVAVPGAAAAAAVVAPTAAPAATAAPTPPAAGAVGSTGLLGQVAAPTIALGTRILTVGADKQFQTVAAAIGASRDGDAILVDAGTYTNDFASVAAKISLYAVGGRVTMLATVPPPNQKGILVEETDLHVEGFTFQGAHIPDDWGHNGAGIRVDNGHLSLVNCAFIGNQDGLLTNAGRGIAVSVDHCLFDGNGGNDGNGAGNIHAIYIGDVASFTIINSTVENTLVGHEVKSRAEVNTIESNTIISGAGSGTGSYAIDLPNGGKSVIRGNTITKGPSAENASIIHFGGEGIPYAGSSLLVEGNLFTNSRNGAVGVLNHTATSATIRGNVLDGLPAGSLVQGPAKASGNWDRLTGALPDATLVGVLPGSTMIVTDALAHQVLLNGGQLQAVQGGAGRLTLDVWAGHIVAIGGAGGMAVTEHGSTGGNQYVTAAGSVNTLALADGMNLVDSEGTDTITMGSGNQTGVVNGTATITGGAGNSTWTINGTAAISTGSGAEFLSLGNGDSRVSITGTQDFFRLDSNGGTGTWDVRNAGQAVKGSMTGGAVTMQVYGGAMHISTSGGGAGSILRLEEGDAGVVSAGQDVIWAGSGTATVLVSGGAEVHAGSGSLAVYARGGGGGADVYGAGGDYVIGGDNGGVTYHGGEEASTVEAQLSGITLLGGAGLMTVNGGARDMIVGGSGGIVFNENGGGANTVTTAAGSRNTLALTGADRVDSGGNDTITTMGGNQDITIAGTASLTLGGGNSYIAVTGHAAVRATGGSSRVDVAAGATADVATTGWMTVTGNGPGVSLARLDSQGVEAGRVSLLAGDAVLGTYGEYGMQVTTGSGHAEVTASGANAGSSLCICSNGADTVRTGDGATTVTLAGGDSEVWAGSGALTVHDWIQGGGAVIHAGSGNVRGEVGWGASMTFLGGSGDAVLDGSTMDIIGGSGSITTTGYYGSGVRSFVGGSGAADLRLDSSGCDLTMGSGAAKVHELGWGSADTYRFTSASTGTTVIENFRAGTDRALLGPDVAIASQEIVGGSAHVRLTNGGDVTFLGVQGGAGLFG